MFCSTLWCQKFLFICVVLPYGKESGDEIKMTDTNLIGPLELSTSIFLYNRNLSELYVSIHMTRGAMDMGGEGLSTVCPIYRLNNPKSIQCLLGLKHSTSI